MPRRASGRKSASKSAGRKSSARTSTGKEAPKAPEGPDIQAIKDKNANPAHREASEETARLNAAAQTPGAPIGNVEMTERQKAGQKALDEQRKADEKALAESRKPPNYNKAVAKVQGQTKILREKGDPPKPLGEGIHKVQQGGGGTIAGDSGQPIR